MRLTDNEDQVGPCFWSAKSNMLAVRKAMHEMRVALMSTAFDSFPFIII